MLRQATGTPGEVLPMRDLLRLHLSNAGYEVLVATRSVPVVLVTGSGDEGARAKKLGAAAFLTKPLLVPELLAAVADHVEAGVAA